MLATGLRASHAGKVILHPSSLQFSDGERVGLVGASGSGKSTLGHALIDALQQAGRAVAHVPQSPDEALDPIRSMAFQWHEAERAQNLKHDPKRQAELFDALCIRDGDLSKRAWAWSRGMQQRFVIAMALIGTPDLLVMDEPTSALDPLVAASTMDLLDAYLENRHTALLLITHDLGLAARRVSRLIVMDKGRVVEDADTSKVLSAPQTPAAKMLCAHRNWLKLPC